MGSISRHFRAEGNRVFVMTRFEGDDEGEGAITGHSHTYVEPGDRYFGIPFDQLFAAGAGEILVSKDGETGSIRAADD